MSDRVLFAVPLRGRVFSSPQGHVCIWWPREDGPRHPVAGGRRPSPRESGRGGGEGRLPRPSLSRLRFSSVLLFVRFRFALVPFLFRFCSTFSAFHQVDRKVPREQLFFIERKGKERKKENPKERIPFGIFRTGRMRMFGLTGSRRRWYRLDRPVRPVGGFFPEESRPAGRMRGLGRLQRPLRRFSAARTRRGRKKFFRPKAFPTTSFCLVRAGADPHRPKFA